MKKIITINLLVVAVILLLFEVAGQAFYHHKKHEWLFMNLFSENLFEPHPWLVGRLKSDTSETKGDVTITSTPDHLRWTGAPADTSKAFRIALIGGSTTFSTGVTDKDSWPAMLQARLGSNYAVYNYGMPGYSTAEGIIQMALQVPEIKPDLVIFYEGWNDIRNYHYANFTPDYYAHGMKQYGNLQIDQGAVDQRSWLWKGADYSALLKFIFRFSNASSAQKHENFDTPDPAVDKVYERNLKTLKTLADNTGAQSLFVPQVLNFAMYQNSGEANPLDPKSVNENDADWWWTPYIRNGAMPPLITRFNGLMQQTCEELNCAYAGEVLNVAWNDGDFVDRGHFTREGGEKFVDLIEKRVREMSAEKMHTSPLNPSPAE